VFLVALAVSVSMLDCSFSKVQRSLKLQKLDEKVLIRLEEVLKVGLASTVAFECSTSPFNLGTCKSMKDALDALKTCGVTPTLNLARAWTAFYASRQFTLKNFVGACAALSVYKPRKSGEVEAVDDNVFDVDQPRMSLVTPDIEDFEALGDDVPEKPESLQDLLLWEVDRAYDKNVSMFPTWYTETAFASPPVLSLLRDSPELATKLFEAWLDNSAGGSAEEREEHHREMQPAVVLASCAVADFAQAYLAVMSRKMFTAESHEIFSMIFASPTTTKRKQNEFTKLMVAASRRNPQFADMESTVIRVAGKELEDGEKIATALRLLEKAATPTGKKDHAIDVGCGNEDSAPSDPALEAANVVDWILEFPKWLKFVRPNCVEVSALAMALHSWALTMTRELLDPADDTKASEKIRFLTICKSALAVTVDCVSEEEARCSVDLRVTINDASASLILESSHAALVATSAGEFPLYGPPYLKVLDAVEDISALKESVVSIFTQQGAVLLSCICEFLNDDVDQEDLISRAREIVRCTAVTYDRLSQVKAAPEKQDMKMLSAIVDKGLAIRVAGDKYIGAKTKANMANLHKAQFNWYQLKLALYLWRTRYTVQLGRRTLMRRSTKRLRN
jgi:hypothetical protein